MAAPFRTEITADRTQYDATMDAAAAKALTTSQAIASAMRETSIQMSGSITQANDRMNASFDTVKQRVESIRGVVVAAAAVMGGGSLFGKMISQTAEMTAESTKLSRVLGNTTQEATTLRIALGDINVPTDDYLSMVGKMTLKLRENEDRFHALGVVTRGANGELLSTTQITANALKALQEFKAGTDRNLAATEFFGRGWADVMKLMRLTPELMEEARKKAEDLQLVVGPKGAERAREYKIALHDVKEIGEALANRVGQAVMPVLTDLGHWFADIGPTAVQMMRGAIGGLMTAFYAFRNGAVIVMETVLAAVYMVTEPIVGLMSAVGSALSGNFEEAGARLREIPKGIEAAWNNAGKNILDSSETTRDRIKALWSMDEEQGTGKKTDKGVKTYTGEQKGNRTSQWEAELAAQRDAYDKQKMEEGSFQQFTLAMERDFWKQKMALGGLNKEEQASVSKKYYDAERQLRKESFDLEIADLKARLEEHKKGSAERILLAGDAAAKIGEKYGVESKEYRQALAEMSKLAHERAEMQRRLNELEIESERNYQMHRIELERENLETLEKLGIIKAQDKIARLKKLAEEEFAIQLKAAEDAAALRSNDEVEHRQALERIAEIRRKHETDMQKLGAESAMATKRTLDTWLDPIGNAVQTMVNGVMQGTQTARQLFDRLMVNMGTQLLSTLTKMGIEWVKAEILKTQATVAGVTARTGAEATGASQSILMTAGTVIKSIGMKAWDAAAGAYAAIAAIPVIGPVLAPGAAIAASAAVLAMVGRISSAAGGFDIPSGVNPITQLHAREMVLPQHIADPLRENLAGGGGLGGEVHNHFGMWDVRGLREFLMQDPEALRPAVGRLARNGGNHRRW